MQGGFWFWSYLCTSLRTNYAIPIYMTRCFGFCFLENTSPSLKPKRSGMSTDSLMTWLLRPWNLKEVLSGPARTTMGMCSLTLLHKVWVFPVPHWSRLSCFSVTSCGMAQEVVLGLKTCISDLWLVVEISGSQKILILLLQENLLNVGSVVVFVSRTEAPTTLVTGSFLF